MKQLSMSSAPSSTMFRPLPAMIALALLLIIVNAISCIPGEDSSHPVVAQAGESEETFERVWERTDGPVMEGSVDRTWIWGPLDRTTNATERYAEAPGGQREVRYFDKSRMELTYPDGDPDSPWFVTNGLLVLELITGRHQVGDTAFDQRAPASVPVAGDPDSDNAPTYATLSSLMNTPAREPDSAVIDRLSREGTATTDPALTSNGVTSAHRVTVLGIDHQVASVFWDFMNTSGLVTVDGQLLDEPLFLSPFYATGYPLTEAYWVTAQVGGVEQDILVQAFERRVLTFTPSNSDGWKVESGNVGQHYYAWLYASEPEPEPDPTATATATLEPTPSMSPTQDPTVSPIAPSPTAPSDDPALVTVGPGAVDAWMRSVVRDADDRLWIVAIDNNNPRTGIGPGRVVMYRATSPGVPVDFEIVESGVVESNSAGGEVVFADAAIDGEQRLHVVWVDRGQTGVPLLYGIFDTVSATWLSVGQEIDTTGLEGFGGDPGQSGASIALDHDGDVRVAYVAAGNHSQIRVRERSGDEWGAFSEPLRQDGSFIWHPVLAIAPDGTWLLAGYDATLSQIVGAQDAGQGWTDAAVIAQNVLGPESIDQGPSILTTFDGTPYVLYVDAQSHLRVSVLDDGIWTDVPVGGDYETHAPGLGIFADGTLIGSGHDEFHPPTGMNVIYGNDSGWSSWEQLVSLEADGSAVFRWAGAFFTPSPGYVDLVFFDEDLNNDGVFDDQELYYVAVSSPSD